MNSWQILTLLVLSALACGVAWLIYRAAVAMVDELDEYIERPYR